MESIEKILFLQYIEETKSNKTESLESLSDQMVINL